MEPRTRFAPGDQVQLRSDPSRVGMVSRVLPPHAGERYYEVFWGSVHGVTRTAERDLLPQVRVRGPFECLAEGRLANYDQFQRFMTLQRLQRDEPLRNNIYAFNASRTRFFPYQFKPLLKFLESPRHRLLIADEVGLGKTIEAGLILTELRARHGLRLALVICPSNLREKWRTELQRRFDESFEILAVRDLMAKLDDYEDRPDRLSLQAIVSLETLRQPRVAQRLEELAVPFDLVIVDEAHHLRNFGTAQRTAVVAATQAAAAVLLLTATPIQLGEQNLYSLLQLLDEDEFESEYVTINRIQANGHIVDAERALAAQEPAWALAAQALRQGMTSPWLSASRPVAVLAERLAAIASGAAPVPDRSGLHALREDLARTNLLAHVFTRTRKRQVQARVVVRRAQSVLVQFSPAEREFYDLVSAFILERSASRGDAPVIAKWVLNTPQRRLTSCLPGMVEYYRTHGLPLEAPTDEEATGGEAEEELAVGDELADIDKAWLKDAGTRLAVVLRDWSADAPDSKYEKLRDVLAELASQRPETKVILFATFRHTLAYLARRLAWDGWPGVVISGATPAAERLGLVDRFRDDATIRVMLASRVGAEGLDFQFCDTIINYDLPWNPMEVEQRIGRIDRIGQQSEVLRIINFWIEGTIEERILRRLYDRIGVFEHSIGELEPILGELASEVQRALLEPALSPEEAIQRAEALAAVIEARRHQAEQLERSMANLIGADQYFQDEIDAVGRRRRFVTPEQLRRFLASYLRRHAPRSVLDYDEERKVGKLKVARELAQTIARSAFVGELTQVLNADEGGGLPITFDSETAFARRGLEFINVLHPLVRLVVSEEAREEVCAAFALRCRSGLLPAGVHAFGVYKVRVSAARSYTTLETVVLGSALDAEACDAATAEQLLGEMVERGEPMETELEVSPEAVGAIEHGLEAAIVARLQALRGAEEAVNDAFIDQRLRSLELGAEKRLSLLRARLAKERSGQRRDKYLRLLEAQRAKAERDLENQRQSLEAGRQLALEHQLVAVGLLEVVNG